MIRQPTPPEVYLAWHRGAVSHTARARHDGWPECGWFKVRRFRGGPWVPLLIGLRQTRDPDTGELVEPEALVPLLAGEPIGADELQRLWLFAVPISREAYRALLDQLRRAPADPGARVDLTRNPVLPGPRA